MILTNDFYPTPPELIEQMLNGQDIEGLIFLEPSAGKGDIIDYLKDHSAKDVLFCEINDQLKTICNTKGLFVGSDFLKLESERISHIDCIVMNPPFANAQRHILHAFNIAPAGCKIIALCNRETITNQYSEERKELNNIIKENGDWQDVGQAFKTAERKTGVSTAIVRLQKKGENYKSEFEGFFMEEEQENKGAEGIMEYNSVRDLVNRYVEAVKLFDKQIEDGIKMNYLIKSFYRGQLCFECTEDKQAKTRQEFKKDLQRDGWKHIFNKMNMEKYSTRGVKEDINKFIEEQTHIPFTMKNIYRMFEIVIGTAGQRMDKALLEVFDKLTEHHHENRYNIEGWKTNSHYLVNQKFILPSLCEINKYHKGNKIHVSYGRNFELIEDLMKALCYISGDDYNKFGDLQNYCRHDYKVITDKKIECFYNDLHFNGANARVKELQDKGIKAELLYIPIEYGKIFEWGYFRIKAFKKGTMHFEFKDADLWGQFNQRISKLKGYPLYEAKTTTKWQDTKTGRQQPKQTANPTQNILFNFSI
jgi:hypothetical protein